MLYTVLYSGLSCNILLSLCKQWLSGITYYNDKYFVKIGAKVSQKTSNKNILIKMQEI